MDGGCPLIWTLISDLFLSYYVSTKDPSADRRKREDVFDYISLTNKPEIELQCRYRIGIYFLIKQTLTKTKTRPKSDSNQTQTITQTWLPKTRVIQDLNRTQIRPMSKCKLWNNLFKSRNITVNADFTAGASDASDSNLMKTGFLQYSATVVDPRIGHDQFTEVMIRPSHHLSNIYVTWVKGLIYDFRFWFEFSFLVFIIISGQLNAKSPPGVANYFQYIPSTMTSA